MQALVRLGGLLPLAPPVRLAGVVGVIQRLLGHAQPRRKLFVGEPVFGRLWGRCFRLGSSGTAKAGLAGPAFVCHGPGSATIGPFTSAGVAKPSSMPARTVRSALASATGSWAVRMA